MSFICQWTRVETEFRLSSENAKTFSDSGYWALLVAFSCVRKGEHIHLPFAGLFVA